MVHAQPQRLTRHKGLRRAVPAEEYDSVACLRGSGVASQPLLCWPQADAQAARFGAACGARWRPFTCRNCSADRAPRVPLEKLSMKRTQLRSNGTVVPPLVTTTRGRAKARVTAVVPPLAPAGGGVECWSMKDATFAAICCAVVGHAARNCSDVQSLSTAAGM